MGVCYSGYGAGHFWSEVGSRLEDLAVFYLEVAVEVACLLIYFVLGSFPFAFVVAGGQFKNAILPFVTSLTGIWLCLQVCSFIAQKIGHNRIIRFVRNHTSDIMIHHMVGFWVLNTLFFALAVPNFNVSDYRANIFYEYYLLGDGHFLILYVLAAFMIPTQPTHSTSTVYEKYGDGF